MIDWLVGSNCSADLGAIFCSDDVKVQLIQHLSALSSDFMQKVQLIVRIRTHEVRSMDI